MKPISISAEQKVAVYTSRSRWTPERPRVLVTCCSDGRLQEAIDEFLQTHLSIVDYDRFYAPGGPGALTPGGYEFLRATQYRDDLAFLIRAHKVEELLLIFHGPAPDGPDEAVCAYYKRVLPGTNAQKVSEQQTQDLSDLQMYLDGLRLTVRIRAFRAEVLADRRVQFVPMLQRECYSANVLGRMLRCGTESPAVNGRSAGETPTARWAEEQNTRSQ